MSGWIGRQLVLTPERIQIWPGRSRHGRIVNWRWYCPCCDSQGVTVRLSHYRADANMPMRERCLRRAYEHLEKHHGYIPVGTQLQLG